MAVGGGRYEVQVMDIDDRVGRPRLDIPKEQLEYLLAMGFSGPQISNAVGASLSTIRRRMTQYGLNVGSLYSDITDQELDSVVSQIKVLFPNCGFHMMQGHLFTQGHRVSQAQVRELYYKGLTLMESLYGEVLPLNVAGIEYSHHFHCGT